MKVRRWVAVVGAAGTLLAGSLGVAAIAASTAGAQTVAHDGSPAARAERKDLDDKVGAVVGVSGDELVRDLKSGQTLDQIGQAHGKTKQQVIDGLVALAKSRLDQAVDSGKLTRAQADKLLAKATTRIGTIVDKPMPHGLGRLFPRVKHDHRDQGGNMPATASTTTTVN
jgi:hypothetical protein